MRFFELILIAVGLSMDAFAVSVCKGLSVRELRPRHAVLTGLYFGGFQMAMPLVGFLLGARFRALIASVSHWFAFTVLLMIGVNMIIESRDEETRGMNDCFAPSAMLPLAVATSIDALAVGVTFAFLRVNILWAVCTIGITTFALCCVGISLGNRIGAKYQSYAGFFGGMVLILMGFHILLEHLL